MKTITDMIVDLKYQDVEINQFGETKQINISAPITWVKYKDGEQVYDKCGYYLTHGYLIKL